MGQLQLVAPLGYPGLYMVYELTLSQMLFNGPVAGYHISATRQGPNMFLSGLRAMSNLRMWR